MRAAAARLLPLVFLAASFVAVWQSQQLETWSFVGPGAGLFPSAIAYVCVALSAVLLLFPGTENGADEAEEQPGPEERRTFRSYLAALVLICFTTSYLGFLATAILLAVLVSWFGERRRIAPVIGFGLLCGVIGIVGFGYYLGVEIPRTELETAAHRFLRSF